MYDTTWPLAIQKNSATKRSGEQKGQQFCSEKWVTVEIYGTEHLCLTMHSVQGLHPVDAVY